MCGGKINYFAVVLGLLCVLVSSCNNDLRMVNAMERASKSKVKYSDDIFLDYHLGMSKDLAELKTSQHFMNGDYSRLYNYGAPLYAIPSVGLAECSFMYSDEKLTRIILTLKNCNNVHDMAVLAYMYVSLYVAVPQHFKEYKNDVFDACFIKDNVVSLVGISNRDVVITFFDASVSSINQRGDGLGIRGLDNSQSL